MIYEHGELQCSLLHPSRCSSLAWVLTNASPNGPTPDSVRAELQLKFSDSVCFSTTRVCSQFLDLQTHRIRRKVSAEACSFCMMSSHAVMTTVDRIPIRAGRELGVPGRNWGSHPALGSCTEINAPPPFARTDAFFEDPASQCSRERLFIIRFSPTPSLYCSVARRIGRDLRDCAPSIVHAALLQHNLGLDIPILPSSTQPGLMHDWHERPVVFG
jgi:hypothetical protein